MTLTQEIQTAMVRNAPAILSEKREEDLLQKAGFVHHLETNKTRRKELDLLQKFGQFITYDEIKTVGLRYDMALVHVSDFKGSPGPNTANRIAEFEAKYGESKATHFFILAPQEMVNGELLRTALDPVLFYRIGKDRFFMIDQWGGDMTWRRRASAFLRKDTFFNALTSVLPVPAIFAIALIGTDACASVGAKETHLFAGIAIGVLAMLYIIRHWLKGGLSQGSLNDPNFDRMYQRSNSNILRA